MIYLLHSTIPVGGKGRASARHYIGHAMENGLEQRMLDHLRGRNSSGVVKAMIETGGTLILARTWPMGGFALERYLKKSGHFADLCPICRRESGKQPLKIQPTLPPVSLPLYVTRLRKRTPVSGGVLLRGKRTTSTGAFQVGLPLESSTPSPVEPVGETATGGTFSAATAQPSPSAVASVGTKQRSSFPGRSGNLTQKEFEGYELG